MPRKQSRFVKYKCCEPFCGKILRQDKWPGHCKKEHAYKFRRYTVVCTLFTASCNDAGIVMMLSVVCLSVVCDVRALWLGDAG